MKYLYHATGLYNLQSIIANGIQKGNDGIVYMSDTVKNAAKFVAVRGTKDIAVFQIDISKLDEQLIEEQFDHSYEFFKCRAWGYSLNVPFYAIENIYKVSC